MALCIVMMVPYASIDEKASFATAFTQVGLPWGQYLVGLGATLGEQQQRQQQLQGWRQLQGQQLLCVRPTDGGPPSL
jgi:hypothetical protein